jgi:hypothetical protein
MNLGYDVAAAPPDKRVFPLHSSHANEWMFGVMLGEGSLHFSDKEFPIGRQIASTGQWSCGTFH